MGNQEKDSNNGNGTFNSSVSELLLWLAVGCSVSFGAISGGTFGSCVWNGNWGIIMANG